MSRSLGYRRSQSCSPVCPTLSRGCRWRNRRLQGQVRSRLRVVFSRTHKHSLACVMHSPSVCHRRPTLCLRRRSTAQRGPRSRHSGDSMLKHRQGPLQYSTHLLTVVISAKTSVPLCAVLQGCSLCIVVVHWRNRSVLEHGLPC